MWSNVMNGGRLTDTVDYIQWDSLGIVSRKSAGILNLDFIHTSFVSYLTIVKLIYLSQHWPLKTIYLSALEMVNLEINGRLSLNNVTYLIKYQQQITNVRAGIISPDLSLCAGNLAHTKGKAMGSARMGTQQSQRTINFAKVPCFFLFFALFCYCHCAFKTSICKWPLFWLANFMEVIWATITYWNLNSYWYVNLDVHIIWSCCFIW